MSAVSARERFVRPRSAHAPGTAALFVLVVLMVLGPMHQLIAPFAPDAATGQTLAPPGIPHIFGTDVVGRDLFSETVHALGTTVNAAWIGVLFVLLPGHFAGLVSAHLFGRPGFVVRVEKFALMQSHREAEKHPPADVAT